MGWLKKVWVKIWSKIKYLFGKRKMEIEKIINKWFQETRSQIELCTETCSSLDALCVCVLKGAQNYCTAISLLLSEGHKMPVKALLRCLCELCVKLAWCLAVPDIPKKEADVIVSKKIRRWEKTTLLKNIKRLKDFKSVLSKDQFPRVENCIDRLEKEPLFSDTKVKEMPQIVQMCEQLSDDVKNRLYPQLYVDFHNAVHLDAKSLVDIYTQGTNNTPSHFGSKYTIEDLARLCMFFAVNINGFIRLNYGLDVTQIKKEYREIVKN